MKKTFFFIIVLLAFVATANAQRYSLNKHNFDAHMYIPEYGDAYNPTISGLCSFLVPGMGQMFCGETGRGMAFLGGYIGCSLLAVAGANQITTNFGYNGYDYNGNPNAGVAPMLIGFGGMIFVSIWSIVDAVHVAKVNNMYYRSLRRTSAIKVEMSPYVEQLSINNQVTTPVGLSMRVKF
jgi:hypothetical protein